jgi:hypothetical protein
VRCGSPAARFVTPLDGLPWRPGRDGAGRWGLRVAPPLSPTPPRARTRIARAARAGAHPRGPPSGGRPAAGTTSWQRRPAGRLNQHGPRRPGTPRAPVKALSHRTWPLPGPAAARRDAKPLPLCARPDARGDASGPAARRHPSFRHSRRRFSGQARRLRALLSAPAPRLGLCAAARAAGAPATQLQDRFEALCSVVEASGSGAMSGGPPGPVPPPARPAQANKVFVGGLSWETT